MNVQITRRISLVNSHMKLLFPSVRVSFFYQNCLIVSTGTSGPEVLNINRKWY